MHICKSIRLKQAYSSDNRWLQSMEKQSRVCISPCKQLNGACVVSDFNRVLLTIAAEHDAAVITNNTFKDIVIDRPGKNYKKNVFHIY